MKIYSRFFKRLLDFILSLLAIVILCPIMIILSLLVRINLGSPIIYKQERPGMNEKIFTLFKFRTMRDAEDSEGNPLPDADRMTKFGTKLRSSSLDELPELFNILLGDMAIVGPRPLLVRYLPLYSERHRHRHDVRPGLTGLAQVNGRNSLTWESKFDMDIDYVNNITFTNDFSIVLKTVKTIVKHDGISSDNSVTMEEYRGDSSKENE